jgi:hypothetical protein
MTCSISVRKRSRRVIRFLLSLSAGEDIIGFIGLLAWRGEDQAYHSNIWRLNQRFPRETLIYSPQWGASGPKREAGPKNVSVL